MIWSLAVLPTLLFLLGFPVYAVLLAAAAVTVVAFTGVPPLVIHQVLYGGVENYALLAVPFFIFAGELMSRCGVSDRLVAWVQSITGHIRGSLALTTIATSTLLGAVSGSSPATVAATGRTLYPELLRAGYERPFSLGLIASSGSVAIIIPPSIAMILYGASAEQSVPKLFMAGIVPGLLIAAFMGVYVLLRARRQKAGATPAPAAPTASFAAATVHAAGALAMPVVVLGGIYAGVFSPTEAGGVACLYSVLLARYVYRSLGWREILDTAADSALLTAQIMIIVASAAVFAWLLPVQGVPQALVTLVQQA